MKTWKPGDRAAFIKGPKSGLVGTVLATNGTIPGDVLIELPYGGGAWFLGTEIGTPKSPRTHWKEQPDTDTAD
jgi:hypothetical protein